LTAGGGALPSLPHLHDVQMNKSQAKDPNQAPREVKKTNSAGPQVFHRVPYGMSGPHLPKLLRPLQLHFAAILLSLFLRKEPNKKPEARTYRAPHHFLCISTQRMVSWLNGAYIPPRPLLYAAQT